ALLSLFPLPLCAFLLYLQHCSLKMTRKCLVCGTPVNALQLGIDACRACAVFYRRARKSDDMFICKSKNDGDCAKTGRILECRKCRFERMNEIFDRANMEVDVTPHSNPRPGSDSRQGSEQPSSSSRPSPPVDVQMSRFMSSSPSTSSTPVLERIRHGYDVMTRVRKISELTLRPLDVHPSDIDDESYENTPTTHEVMLRTRRILVSAVFDFASIAFPEFMPLAKEEKWRIVAGNSERMSTLESAYRAAKIYPNNGTIFTSYTTTLSTDLLEGCLLVCPLNVDVDTARKEMGKMLEENVRNSKRKWQRVDPNHDEFLFLIALAFWNTSDESLGPLASKNRAGIMQDLHAYYTKKRVADYAMRIGELFCL
ncbi:hypothetical protein PMAYCL1PPCAC_17085, partial [Pristionchus mayeri]